MKMRSNNAVIKKCVVQRFGVRTPELTQFVPKSSQDGPKMAPRWPQDGPKRPPRGLQEGPKRPQEAPPTHSRRPRAQDGHNPHVEYPVF